MNNGPRIGLIILLSILLTVFIGVGIVFIPSARHSVGEFLLSPRLNTSYPDKITADVYSSLNSSTTKSSVVTQNVSTSTIDSQLNAQSQITAPSTYEYKLLRTVDECELTALGSQGFQAVQFGGSLDLSTGKDGDCTKLHIVNVLDWVLFVREKK